MGTAMVLMKQSWFWMKTGFVFRPIRASTKDYQQLKGVNGGSSLFDAI
jgi:hypothetical protein